MLIGNRGCCTRCLTRSIDIARICTPVRLNALRTLSSGRIGPRSKPSLRCSVGSLVWCSMACSVCGKVSHNSVTCPHEKPRAPVHGRRASRCACCGQYGYSIERHHTRGRSNQVCLSGRVRGLPPGLQPPRGLREPAVKPPTNPTMGLTLHAPKCTARARRRRRLLELVDTRVRCTDKPARGLLPKHLDLLRGRPGHRNDVLGRLP